MHSTRLGLRVAGRKISESRHSRDQWLLMRRAFGQAASYPSQVMSTCSTSHPLWVAVPVLLIAALVARNLPAFVAMSVSGYWTVHRLLVRCRLVSFELYHEGERSALRDCHRSTTFRALSCGQPGQSSTEDARN